MTGRKKKQIYDEPMEVAMKPPHEWKCDIDPDYVKSCYARVKANPLCIF